MKKPVRLANDPPGFDPVFDDSEDGYHCSRCHVLGMQECFSAPCFSVLRPERRSVYYIGQTRTSRAPDPLRRELPDAWPAVLAVAAAAALVAGACIWASTVKATPLVCPRCGAPVETKGTP